MKSLWHFGDSKHQQNVLKEHQLHLQTNKKLLIAIFMFSVIYFLVDAGVCIHINNDFNYLSLILALSFQLVKIILFFCYLKITIRNPDKHSFFLEFFFVLIFCVSTILTWNLQIDLDPSRIYIVGIETGWTFLYVHTLFGRWPWKAIIYASASLFGIYKMIMASQELSPGVCQAILQLALVIVSALIEESRKKQKVLESISLEKTGQTLKNILNSLPDNIAILNLDGDIRFYNDFFGISFKLTDNVSSEGLFSQIFQVKPRDRHLNLQKIQERYNFIRPSRKTFKRPNANLSPASRQSFAKADNSSNTLMQYLTDELETANVNGSSVAQAKNGKSRLQRARSARFSQLPPLKTLTEFFSSINYFKDLQEVLEFFCLNVDIIRTYTEKEKSFFIFDGKYKTGEGLNKSFEIKISLSNFDNEESFVLILRDTTHRDIIVTLEDHNNFKDSVLSSLSHELKTPLNTNLNMLQLAIDAYNKISKNLSMKFPSWNGVPEENPTLIATETTLTKMDFKDSFLVPAHKCGKLLESLINDIVDYSMLLARKFSIKVKQKYLNKSIEKILYMCEFQAQKKNLELRVNISPAINFKIGTDHKRLRQIITNLINNAIKFTYKGFVSLDIEPYCDNSQLIQFTVKDSGIGIDKAGLERMTTILDAGNFLDKLNQESSGVGMGLVISHLLAKEIGPTAQRMSGIKIESTRNKGSKFRFVIENFVNGPPSPESKILDGTNLLNKQKEKVRSESRKCTLLLRDIRTDSRKSTLFFGSSTETFPSRGDKLRINNISSITDRRDQMEEHIMIPISDINDRDMDEENAQMLKDANLRKSLLGESRLSKRESQFPRYPSFDIKSSIPCRLVLNGSESPSFVNSGQRDIDGSPRTNLSHLNQNLDFFRSVLIPVPLSDSVEMIEKPMKNCMCPEVLVVDDDMFNLFTMENLFANFNFQIAKATNGEEAIEIVQKRERSRCNEECKPFKLIFMDVSMPIMDGFETTLKLREMMGNQEISEIPIIACTAFVEEEKTAKCFECGMEEKISKPVSRNKLAEILRKFKVIEKIEIESS